MPTRFRVTSAADVLAPVTPPAVVPTVNVPVPELINVSVTKLAFAVITGILTEPELLLTIVKFVVVPAPGLNVPILIGPEPDKVKLVTFVVVNVVTVNSPADVFVNPVYVAVAIVSPVIVTAPVPETLRALILVSVSVVIVTGAVFEFVVEMLSVLPVSVKVPISIGPLPPNERELRLLLVRFVIPEASVDVLVLFQAKELAKPFVKFVMVNPPVPELLTANKPVSLKVVITFA